jgi:hypothetical protein
VAQTDPMGDGLGRAHRAKCLTLHRLVEESFLHSPKMPHQMSHLLEKKHVIHSDILGYFCFYILLLD